MPRPARQPGRRSRVLELRGQLVAGEHENGDAHHAQRVERRSVCLPHAQRHDQLRGGAGRGEAASSCSRPAGGVPSGMALRAQLPAGGGRTSQMARKPVESAVSASGSACCVCVCVWRRTAGGEGGLAGHAGGAGEWTPAHITAPHARSAVQHRSPARPTHLVDADARAHRVKPALQRPLQLPKLRAREEGRGRG